MSVCISYQRHPQLAHDSLAFKFCMGVVFSHFPTVLYTEHQWSKKQIGFFICLQVIFYAWQNSCITCQEPEQVLFFINNSSNIVFNIKYVQENTFNSVFFISLADMKSNQICTILIPFIIHFGIHPDNLFASHVLDYL